MGGVHGKNGQPHRFEPAAWLKALLSRFRPKPLTKSHATGVWGEQQAERHLKRKRYKILGRRVRVGDRDELDLVARDGQVLVFVEVKTRRSADFGRPVSAVDHRKRHALSRAAVRYLKELRFPTVYYRFDVVEVIGLPDAGPPDIRHIENAFTLDRSYRPPY